MAGAMRVWLIAFWLLASAATLFWRPLVPVDETRYLSVAWEMWVQRSFAVPLLNGLPYAHKPPLLFWLIQIGWSVFGVNAWWPRLLGPLFTLIDVLLLDRLARRLWPTLRSARNAVPALFLSSWFVTAYSSALMFDMLLLIFILCAWLALYAAWQSRRIGAFAAYGLAIGAGLLAKGPVAYVYTLPVALLMPSLMTREGSGDRHGWYLSCLAAAAAGTLLPCIWLAAAMLAGDSEYFRHLLVDQTFDRVSGTLGHGRPVWWYLPLLPVLLLPWIAWPQLWKALRILRGSPADDGTRFIGLIVVTASVILSCIGGKQVHYLLPILAGIALIFARALATPETTSDDEHEVYKILVPLALLITLAGALYTENRWRPWLPPCMDWFLSIGVVLTLATMLMPRRFLSTPIQIRTIATISVTCVAITIIAIFREHAARFDLATLGQYLGNQQMNGRLVAFLGEYQGQFGFYGRLRHPIVELADQQFCAWAQAHPQAIVVLPPGRAVIDPAVGEYHQQAMVGEWLIVRAEMIGKADVSVCRRSVADETSTEHESSAIGW